MTAWSPPQDEADGQAGAQGWRLEGPTRALTAAAPEADPSPRLRLEGPGVHFAFTTPTWGSVTCHHSSDRRREGGSRRGGRPSTRAVRLSDTEKPKKPRAKRDTPATPHPSGRHPWGLHRRDRACVARTGGQACCDRHHGAVTAQPSPRTCVCVGGGGQQEPGGHGPAAGGAGDWPWEGGQVRPPVLARFGIPPAPAGRGPRRLQPTAAAEHVPVRPPAGSSTAARSAPARPPLGPYGDAGSGPGASGAARAASEVPFDSVLRKAVASFLTSFA